MASSLIADQLSATFAALADPTRRAILARLSAGETSVKALAEPFAMTAPAVTKHLKVLERAGLITRGREAQWRPARLEAAPLREATAWMEQYRRHWEARLDRLDGYLNELQAKLDTSATSEVALPADNPPDASAPDTNAGDSDDGPVHPSHAALAGGRQRRARARRVRVAPPTAGKSGETESSS